MMPPPLFSYSQENGIGEACDKVYLIVQSSDLNPFAANYWHAKLSPNGNSITIQHPMHDTFLLTQPDGFSEALAAADVKGATTAARDVGLKSTFVMAVKNAPLLEEITLGTDQHDPKVDVPMTDTTIMFPDGISVNNASFNTEGKFNDPYSLVTRFMAVSDFVDDSEFDTYDSDKKHHERSEQHGALWAVFTMALEETKKELELGKTPPKPKGRAKFSFSKRG